MTLAPLNTQSGPTLITPPHQASPSRYAGERKIIYLLRKYFPQNYDHHSVLDLGCGWGEYRFLFPEADYLGVDSRDFNFAAKRKVNVDFQVMDAAKNNFSDFFDLVFINYALQYFDDELKVLCKTRAALKKNGMILFSVPSRWVKAYEWPSLIISLGGTKVTIVASPGSRYYTKQRIEEILLKAGFEPIEICSGSGPMVFLTKFSQITWSFILKIFYHGLYSIAFIVPFFRKKVAPYFLAKRKAVLFLPLRTIREARDYKEFRILWEKAMNNRSLGSQLYTQLVNLAWRLDEMLWPEAMVEYVVLAKAKGSLNETR